MKHKQIKFSVRNDPGQYQEEYRVTITPNDPITTSLIEVSYTDKKIYPHFKYAAHGMSVLKHGDAYNCETGTRFALRSALRKIEDDKLRSAIWAEYLKLFPVDKRIDTREEFKPDDFIGFLKAFMSRAI